jgi:hypothetical protein
VKNTNPDGHPVSRTKTSTHKCTHPKRRRRQERAWARGAERPKETSEE